MKTRLVLAAFLPLCAFAQLQTFVIDRGAERPLGVLYDLGSIAAGDTMKVGFRTRNTGTAKVELRTITVAGAGFSLSDYPSLPYTVAPGMAAEFTVRFAPGMSGAFSAGLSVNGAAAILRATAVSAVTVLVERDNGSAELLTTGAVIDFGRVERGAAATRRLRLENRSGGWLRIEAARVQGQFFSGPAGLALPVVLDREQNVSFEVRFSPPTVGQPEGSLDIDGRRFVLRGTGTEIPLPRPAIRVELDALTSARQGTLRIEFAEAVRRAATGKVSIEFRSEVAGVAADPAILFLPASSRFAQFTVTEGGTRARFGERDDITFQTGATAGALVLTASLGEHTEEFIVPIAPAPAGFASVTALRSGSLIELQITGYDNVRSISRMTFAFYDAKDAPIAPGAIQVDVARDFRRYFESSVVGGVFAMRAIFPVLGNPSEVVSVEAEAANSIGSTRSARIRLP